MSTKRKPKVVADDPPSYGPFDIGDGNRAWFYVDGDSINVICQLYGEKGYLGVTAATLTKKQIESALKLMERP